jgi:hypothetical protein
LYGTDGTRNKSKISTAGPEMTKKKYKNVSPEAPAKLSIRKFTMNTIIGNKTAMAPPFNQQGQILLVLENT